LLFLLVCFLASNADSNPLYEGLLDEPEPSAQGMVNPTTYLRWFKPIEAMSRGDTVVYFQVPDPSFAGWITANYRDIVEEALEAIGLAGYRFEFVIRRE
jgi:chromosomal replication initiation ATPase DnaA